MEGDAFFSDSGALMLDFNPLPPHGGRRHFLFHLLQHLEHFNPLPPHGGRRIFPEVYIMESSYFNPLPPHGGRHNPLKQAIFFQTFQSTPSAWRETIGSLSHIYIVLSFQSTPSAWRETRVGILPVTARKISIHSLRMEGDITIVLCGYFKRYFNPLPPHGGRPENFTEKEICFLISIHSLRMEGDIPKLRYKTE